MATREKHRSVWLDQAVFFLYGQGSNPFLMLVERQSAVGLVESVALVAESVLGLG